MIYYYNLGYIYKLTLKNEFIHICTEYHSNEIRYIAEIHDCNEKYLEGD